jgi:PhnB protein
MTAADRHTTIHRYFETWRTGDRAALEALLTADFEFTSPEDDHIDREAFFSDCWGKKAGSFASHDLGLILTEGDDAVVRYEGASKDGAAFCNIERLRFDGDHIRSVEVFYGLPTGAEAQSPEAAIRTLLEQRQEGFRARDARLVAAKHAADARTFALYPPLVSDGNRDKELSEWFKGWRTEIGWDTRDLKVTVSGDLAFLSALEHLTGAKTDGGVVDLWFRTTIGLRKVAGEWKIVHEHQSVPFYPDGRAAVDLKPQTAKPAVIPTARRSGQAGDARLH